MEESLNAYPGKNPISARVFGQFWFMVEIMETAAYYGEKRVLYTLLRFGFEWRCFVMILLKQFHR